MKCSNSGKEIANDSVSCEYCGERISEEMNVPPKASMTTFQKILIGALVVYCVFAMVMLVNSISEYDGDLFVLLLYTINIIGACMIIGGIWQKSILDKKPFRVKKPNGLKPNTLGSFLGIGQLFMGGFKYRKVDESYVVYRFFWFLLPLFPTGCYRVQLPKLEEGMSNDKQEWVILGSEDSNGFEILNIYLIIIGGIVWGLSVNFVLVFCGVF